MATYLALCQKLASDSGTISGTLPSTVVGQTQRLAKIVRWTNDAWRSIQNAHGSWRWMRSDFAGQTVIGQRRYTGTDFGISRLAEWIYSGMPEENRYSCYKTATGVADEGPLCFLDWDMFYATKMRGPQTSGRPAYFTITPENEIALAPLPDAAYTVRGPYRKDVQDLTVPAAIDASPDDNIPEMPVRFHDLIVDVALMMLGTHDEAQVQVPLWRLRQLSLFSDLERDQLPRISMAGTLA